MNFSRDDSKNDPKQDAGHAPVTTPSTLDTRKGDGPAQAGQKGSDAKPGVQAPGASDAAKNDAQHDAKTDKQVTGISRAEDKASSESMVSEGGHAAPGATPSVVREPDASIIAKDEPPRGSADVAADKYGL